MAFGLFTVVKTVKEAHGEKQLLRRKSEIDSELFSSPKYIRTQSLSLSELRRVSEYPGSPGTTAPPPPTSILTQNDLSEMYENLLPQYVITPIEEGEEVFTEDETSMDNPDGTVNNKSNFLHPHDHPTFQRPRTDSSNSDNNAERLFRFIFSDPNGVQSQETTTTEDEMKKNKTVSLAVEKFKKVRNSLWSSSSPLSQGSSSNSFEMQAAGTTDEESPITKAKVDSNKVPTDRKSSEPAKIFSDGQFSKAAKPKKKFLSIPAINQAHLKKSSLTGEPPNIQFDERLSGILRKDSVASHHAPIGPEESKLIQARQKRRVGMSFHDHENSYQKNKSKNNNKAHSQPGSFSEHSSNSEHDA